ncbi:hypothetical protein TB2_006536 [Malus domestica]
MVWKSRCERRRKGWSDSDERGVDVAKKDVQGTTALGLAEAEVEVQRRRRRASPMLRRTRAELLRIKQPIAVVGDNSTRRSPTVLAL